MDSEADVPTSESAAPWFTWLDAPTSRHGYDLFVYASASSGSRWRGDSVQVSLCVWCPSKDHTPSDRRRDTDAGNVEWATHYNLSSCWTECSQMAVPLKTISHSHHSSFLHVDRWRWIRRRCRTSAPCSCQQWNLSTRASSSSSGGKILLVTPWKSSGSPRMLTTRSHLR